jgi:hypothetical protein
VLVSDVQSADRNYATSRPSSCSTIFTQRHSQDFQITHIEVKVSS